MCVLVSRLVAGKEQKRTEKIEGKRGEGRVIKMEQKGN